MTGQPTHSEDERSLTHTSSAGKYVTFADLGAACGYESPHGRRLLSLCGKCGGRPNTLRGLVQL